MDGSGFSEDPSTVFSPDDESFLALQSARVAESLSPEDVRIFYSSIESPLSAMKVVEFAPLPSDEYLSSELKALSGKVYTGATVSDLRIGQSNTEEFSHEMSILYGDRPLKISTFKYNDDFILYLGSARNQCSGILLEVFYEVNGKVGMPAMLSIADLNFDGDESNVLSRVSMSIRRESPLLCLSGHLAEPYRRMYVKNVMEEASSLLWALYLYDTPTPY